VTLIVGIRCTDAVVLAADGAATVTTGAGQMTARQRTRKLFAIADRAVFGLSGDVSMAQEMALSLEACLIQPDRDGWSEHALRTQVRDALVAPVRKTLEIHQGLRGVPGVGGPLEHVLQFHALLALPVGGAVRLYEVAPECSLTEAREDLPTLAVGSGQPVADVFLAFVRRALWSAPVPPRQEGELAAYWTLHHGIETCPAYVAEPIQLIVVTAGPGATITISERGPAEFEAMETVIAEAEGALRDRFRLPPPPPAAAGGA
jgi:proteasome subunit B (beta)-like protein